MKKILFPFYNKDLKLRDFWWHRLITILFFFFIIILPFLLTSFQVNDAYKVWHHCADMFGGEIGTLQWSDNVTNYCGGNAVKSIGNIWSISIFYTLIFFYLLQIIYYKIFLYIIWGNKNKIESEINKLTKI